VNIPVKIDEVGGWKGVLVEVCFLARKEERRKMFPARLSLRDNKRGGKLLFIISLSGAQRKFLGSFPRIKSLISRGEMWLFMRSFPLVSRTHS